MALLDMQGMKATRGGGGCGGGCGGGGGGHGGGGGGGGCGCGSNFSLLLCDSVASVLLCL